MQFTIRKYHSILFLTTFLIFSISGDFSYKAELSSNAGSKENLVFELFNSPEEAMPDRTSTGVPEPLKNSESIPQQKFFSDSLPQEPKKIALTFDDGPHPGYTEKLLDLLHQAKVCATFFVVGKQVERYPLLLEKIFGEGHEIANHSYSHRDLRLLNDSEFFSELKKTHQLVESLTDQKMRYFRPPGGQYNPEVETLAKAWGYEMVLWTVFAGDHSNPSSHLLKKRILKGASDNGIILLHSGVENTLKVLPEVIGELKKRGYRLVTISELSPSMRIGRKKF